MRQGTRYPCHSDIVPPLPGRGNLNPSCHPSSFACAAVLLVDLHSLPRRDTSLSSPLALESMYMVHYNDAHGRKERATAPGKNITMSHPHSSLHPHCRTLHSNLAPRKALQVDALRKTHIRPPRPKMGTSADGTCMNMVSAAVQPVLWLKSTEGDSQKTMSPHKHNLRTWPPRRCGEITAIKRRHT